MIILLMKFNLNLSKVINNIKVNIFILSSTFICLHLNYILILNNHDNAIFSKQLFKRSR